VCILNRDASRIKHQPTNGHLLTFIRQAIIAADVIERQLAHVPGDPTRAAYNRAQYMDQRRAMLEVWAKWLAVQV